MVFKYKEFAARELFTVESNPQLDKRNFNFNNNGAYPYFTRTVLNNGILGYVDYLDDEHIVKGGCLAVGMLGMNFFYFDRDFYAGQFTKHIRPINFKLNRRLALYFKTIFDKCSDVFTSVLVRDFAEVFYNTKLSLPINENDEIDFPFMENRIRELELARIREIEAYLMVTGLTDYKLTKAEKNMLEKFDRGGVSMKSFKIIDIFDIKNTHSILSSEVRKKPGSIPYVTASTENNATVDYVNYDMSLIDEGNSIMIGGKTLVITYQPKDYFSNDSHNLALYPKNPSARTKEIQLFLVSSLYKSLREDYTWGNSISYRKIQNDQFILPIKDSGNPDYNFMESYIKAQQKLVIRNVVEWKDIQIANTRFVVNAS
ncbi:MAG: restriction endonuclease subunit S [Clostridiales Family XIII bacterium]|jgi:hypothetical protein|nr:restriction endonuclease subunit S [Clostridiales Family XIII bacterium]